MILVDTIDDLFGRNVAYDQENVKIYDKLLDDQLSPFHGDTMANIFVYAAVYGFIDGRRSELKKAVDNVSAVALTPSQKGVLLAIAINTEGLDVLFEKNKAIKIIEEFANAGIDRLESDLVKGHTADSIVAMASMMKKIAEERADDS